MPRTSGTERRGTIPDMIGISERPKKVPKEVLDRIILRTLGRRLYIMGKGNTSAIATLAERVTSICATHTRSEQRCSECAESNGPCNELFSVSIKKDAYL